MTSAAPARMSLASTGAPDSSGDAVDHDVVAVDPGVGAEPGELLDRPETRLEQVLGDHGAAVGDGVVGQRERLQVGREARVGQRRDVERPRPAPRPDAPGTRRAVASTSHPAPASTSSDDVQVLGHAADDLDVAARRRGGEGPGAGGDAVGDDARARSGASASTPSISMRRRAGAARCARPSTTSISAMSTISGSRAALSMRVVPAGEHRGHEDVLGGARRSGSRGGRRAPCSPCGRLGDEVAVGRRGPRRRAPRGPAACRSRPREPMASPPGTATSASPHAGDERARGRRWRRAARGPGRSRPGGRCARARRSRRRRRPAS